MIYVHSINNVLSRIEPYEIKDLTNANLMNRVESKFLLPISTIPTIFTKLQTSFRVLDINGQRISNYKDKYYDTLAMKFYHDHHDNKLNRFKVHHRQYVDTKTSFLELKHKNHQGRTQKTRIKMTHEQLHHQQAQDFIFNSVAIPLSEMEVSQYSGYQRITLASEERAERLTIDFNLWYSRDKNYKIKLPNICIVALKQKHKSTASPFYSLQENIQSSPISFSKYCIGCALLHRENLKSKRFKTTLNKLKALIHQQSYFNKKLYSVYS